MQDGKAKSTPLALREMREDEGMKSILYLAKCLSMLTALFGISLIACAEQQSELKPIKGDLTSDRYEINQTYGGKSFWKDNNIWVYSRNFAEMFGMPASGIAEDIQGIEAAAFRVEDAGYRLCGMGGSAENCFPSQDRCMLDIYIDERKFPLPWAYPEQKADWYEYYNSAQWLRVPKEEDPLNKPTDRIIPNKRFQGDRRLRAVFADPESKNEAALYTKGSCGIALVGYKRLDKKGLSQLTLDTFCDVSDKRLSHLMLATTEDSCYFGDPPPKKVFHNMVIPKAFITRAGERLSVHKKETQEYLKGLYQSMGAVPKQ